MLMENMGIGIKKEVDRVGRIVIPIEYRNMYHLYGDVEMVATSDGLLIRNPKYKIVAADETTASQNDR